MSAIEHLLREPAAQAIGWALLHFIWQGTLVAALTGIVLACLRNGAADVRLSDRLLLADALPKGCQSVPIVRTLLTTRSMPATTPPRSTGSTS